MNEQSYKSLVLRKFHAFSRNQTPIISYLSCIVSNNKQRKSEHGSHTSYPLQPLDKRLVLFIVCLYYQDLRLIYNFHPTYDASIYV
jgi:hypothetical protein